MAATVKTVRWQPPLIIGVLVVLALLINFYFFNKAQNRREAEAKEAQHASAAAEAKQASQDAEAKRVQSAAEEHNRLLVRYLNSGFTRKPGEAIIGVAIESEDGTVNPSIAVALEQRLQSADVRLLNSLFKPEFVSDKYVASIFSGDTGIFDRLGVTNWLNGVLVGRQTISYSKNTELQNTITANLRLQLLVLPVGLTLDSQSWFFSATGVGFNESDARAQAEDRLVHRIATDTNISLTYFSTKELK